MMICAGHHLVLGGEHVSYWQLLALGWPALGAAWRSPAASKGWDAKTWSARGLAWVGLGGVWARRTKATLVSRIRPTDKNDEQIN